MRRLVWIAAGFCVGCAAGAYLCADTRLLPFAVLAAVAAGIFFSRKKTKAALVSLGMAVSLLWTFLYCGYTFADAVKYDERTLTLTATATDYAEGSCLPGKLTVDGKTYKATVYYDGYREVCPGDTLTGSFYLLCTAPGSALWSSYYSGEGICFLAYAGEDVVHNRGGDSLLYFPQRLRRIILYRLNDLFPADTEGFARALLLGDTSGLTYEQDIAFQVSGIRHVVAVSGMHISVLFSLIYLLSGKGPVKTALLGIPILLLFAAVAGFSPSILRACVMQLLMIFAMLFKKEYDPPTALAFAVLVILTCSPMAVASVSFQLSCGCIVGIFLFSGRIFRRLTRGIKGNSLKVKIRKGAASSLSVTAGTVIVTTPLCALYFGNVSLVGFLTNLLTLFAVSLVFYGIIAAVLLSVFSLAAGKFLALLVSPPAQYVLGVAGVLSEIPFAAVYTASPYIVFWLIFCYGLFFLFWKTGRKHPAGVLTAMAGMLIACVTLTCLEPRMDNYRVTVLDVGQGQCILLQSKGKTYMVDCGGSSDKKAANTAVAQLHSQGIWKLDGIILTHYDEDHAGGLSYLLTRIGAEVVYLPNADTCPLELPAGQTTEKVEDVTTFPCGKGTITLIPGQKGAVDNETSTCILYQVEECDILITGDRAAAGEAYLLEQYDIPQVEVLVAGHHGADESTEMALLRRTKPKIVAISVGENNHYGHPGEKTLLRLRAWGCRILRTDLHGTILIRG